MKINTKRLRLFKKIKKDGRSPKPADLGHRLVGGIGLLTHAYNYTMPFVCVNKQLLIQMMLVSPPPAASPDSIHCVFFLNRMNLQKNKQIRCL